MIILSTKLTFGKWISKSETGGRTRIMIKKDTIKHSIAIRLKNEREQNSSSPYPCVKFHGLNDVLRETGDYNEITKMLREVHQFNPNAGHHRAMGHLRTKDVKFKRVNFQLILKNLKNSQPIPTDVIRRRTHKNRSANDF